MNFLYKLVKFKKDDRILYGTVIETAGDTFIIDEISDVPGNAIIKNTECFLITPNEIAKTWFKNFKYRFDCDHETRIEMRKRMFSFIGKTAKLKYPWVKQFKAFNFKKKVNALWREYLNRRRKLNYLNNWLDEADAFIEFNDIFPYIDPKTFINFIKKFENIEFPGGNNKYNCTLNDIYEHPEFVVFLKTNLPHYIKFAKLTETSSKLKSNLEGIIIEDSF